MTTTHSTTDQIATVRQKTTVLLDRLAEQGKAARLPEPPAALARSRQKLAEDTYSVLVVGEAKRGKSTFVNALIGRDILPTAVDIATSQVFRIHQAEHEAYRLCFEDGSHQEISAGDLARFGSQVVADVDGEPRLDQMVRWLEVDGPVRFLPAGVALLDTPGLGSLYARHAEVTHRFVPHADAVIFVLDSGQPIVQDELTFIDTLLGVTRNLFFIQTKIDQFRRDHWQQIQRRNQSILQERFGERLLDARVWPISSVNLMRAAATGDEDFLMVSRHQEMAAALQTFLFRVAGWGRAADALLVAEGYHATARQALAGRLAGLTQASKQRRDEMQQQAAQQKKQFDADWGERGQKRQHLVTSLQKVVAVGKRSFMHALEPGGEIDTAQRDRITAIQTVEEAQQVGASLSDEVIAAVTERWRQVGEHVQTQCTALLEPFVAAGESLAVVQTAEEPDLAVTSFTSSLGTSQDWWTRTKEARLEAVQATSAAGLGIFLLSFAISLGPLAPFGIAAAALWGFRHGTKAGQANRVRAAQEELRKHLAETLQRVRQHFLTADLANSRFSLLDEAFDPVVRGLTEEIQRIAAQKSREAQDELNRLAEEAKLDDQQRKARVEHTQQHLTRWDALGASIAEVVADLKALETSS
jgi:GTPase SAR1 family protein